MTTIYTTHPRYTEHDAPGHPEHAERIRAVWQHLDDHGLSGRMNAVTPQPISDESDPHGAHAGISQGAATS